MSNIMPINNFITLKCPNCGGERNYRVKISAEIEYMDPSLYNPYIVEASLTAKCAICGIDVEYIDNYFCRLTTAIRRKYKCTLTSSHNHASKASQPAVDPNTKKFCLITFFPNIKLLNMRYKLYTDIKHILDNCDNRYARYLSIKYDGTDLILYLDEEKFMDLYSSNELIPSNFEKDADRYFGEAINWLAEQIENTTI